MGLNAFVQRCMKDYLDNREIFPLSDFRRYSWVSSKAQEVWQGRFDRIRLALLHMEALAVAKRLKEISLISINQQELPLVSSLCLQQNVSFLLAQGWAKDGGVLAVGSYTALNRYQVALKEDDTDAIADILGYPYCCYLFTKQIAESYALHDLMLPAYYNSFSDEEEPIVLSGAIAHSPCVEINFFWRSLGFYTTPMTPCSLHCHAAQEYALKFLKIGHEAGYSDEMEWLIEVFSWPVLWTALHGIAELKSPLIKVVYPTDIYCRKASIGLTGSFFPAEGAYGIHFPFREKPGKTYSGSRAFQSGITYISQDP